ncbi:MAG: glycosyltransferase [Pirellulales bacterium]
MSISCESIDTRYDAASPFSSEMPRVTDDLAARLRSQFDACVMLTWSDWHTEPRSNRYHYATRFARCLPVLFAQPNVETATYFFESTNHHQLDLLNYSASLHEDSSRQVAVLGQALHERGVIRPLLWMYNPWLHPFYTTCFSPLRVYHGTEDYFTDDALNFDAKLINAFQKSIDSTDLLVGVSSGVVSSYVEKAKYRNKSIVATNGCDFEFLSNSDRNSKLIRSPDVPTVIYQGGINRRIDFPFLLRVVRDLPDCRFLFCGHVAFLSSQQHLVKEWKQILEEPNVRFLGQLTPEQLRDEMQSAQVGIIPFGTNRSTRERSFPLKAFEYVACGLPVVSVPVKQLQESDHANVFRFADSPQEFAASIREAIEDRYVSTLLSERAEAGKAHSYDIRFESVTDAILNTPRKAVNQPATLRVLVLYDDRSIHVKTIEHHLRSFSLPEGNEVYYAPATGEAVCHYDLANFDCILLHYCIRVCVPGHLSESYENALRSYPGLKVLFLQDEYDHTDLARDAIEQLGVQLVYTVVPEHSIPLVYPPERFSHVEFIPTLTGFVPLDIGETMRRKPIAERHNLICYRGREIGFWYGDLARQKVQIGEGMLEVCTQMGVSCDIRWDNESRIYGDAWFSFLSDSRAMLATESGSNVFDFDGSIKHRVEQALLEEPQATYASIHRRYVAAHEGRIIQNQISPKLFEAIACGTLLVLFEGKYSGILEPWVHFLPLAKDFSNAREIIKRLHDDQFVETMTARAFTDIVESGLYSYATFGARVMDVLTARSTCRRPAPIGSSVTSSAPVPSTSISSPRGTRAGINLAEETLHKLTEDKTTELTAESLPEEIASPHPSPPIFNSPPSSMLLANKPPVATMGTRHFNCLARQLYRATVPETFRSWLTPVIRRLLSKLRNR